MNVSVIVGRLLESSLINLELFAVTLLLGLPLNPRNQAFRLQLY